MEFQKKINISFNNLNLPITTPNNNGFTNSNRNRMTWYNFNLRQCLDIYYDEYDYYRLKLLTISNTNIRRAPDSFTSVDGSNNPIIDNQFTKIWMSGLDFVNQNSTDALLGFYRFFQNGANTAPNSTFRMYENSDTIVFRKQPSANISFYITRMSDNYFETLPKESNGTVYPELQIYLEITPLCNYEE